MVHGDTKCFSTGSQEPQTKDQNLTLYSMRFCPYADRARLTLNVKGIPHDIVNIDLTKKPEWYLKRNPLGKVPALEQSNRVIYESLIVAEYLDDTQEGKRKLLPTDPYERAKQKMLIEVVGGKITPVFYGLMKEKDDVKGAADKLHKALEEVEKLLTNDFFAGKEYGFVDLMVFPWIQRFPGLKQVVNEFEWTDSRFPKLTSWLKRMMAIPEVKESMQSDENVKKFFESARSGTANYDTGL